MFSDDPVVAENRQLAAEISSIMRDLFSDIERNYQKAQDALRTVETTWHHSEGRFDAQVNEDLKEVRKEIELKMYSAIEDIKHVWECVWP